MVLSNEACCHFHAAFRDDLNFHTAFCDDPNFNTSFGEIIQVGELPWYDGEYTVVPKAEEQTLPTGQTSMREDLTIQAIPYYEVSNPQNGKTVIIGGN